MMKMKIRETYLEETDGYIVPVFVSQDGTEYIGHYFNTGNCSMLSFGKRLIEVKVENEK